MGDSDRRVRSFRRPPGASSALGFLRGILAARPEPSLSEESAKRRPRRAFVPLLVAILLLVSTDGASARGLSKPSTGTIDPQGAVLRRIPP